MSYIRTHFLQLVRFGISGSVAALSGIISLYVLTDIVGIWYVASSVLAFFITFIIVFILQKFWTFKETSVSTIPRQTAQNFALSIFNLFFNTALIYVLVDIADLNHILAQALIYGLIGAIDFFVYKYWIFRFAD
ncbi:MAG: hypothetical protein G01um10148_324 [Parcubacteria group bacterium Gr01-1014_8]|nr:MAG: hypothetical protein G01um10148_324 [Parcubacteria group bacterium Gr01-1014_8]